MKKNKKIFIIIPILLIALSLVVFIYKDVIYQEGNPLPIFKGMLQLNDSTTFVKINDNPVVFLTKTNNKEDMFSYIEKGNNVSFKEQIGSGHIFVGKENNIIMTSRQYTRFYQVWKYSEQINTLD